MRLGQLSRKLDISTTKIVSFIGENFETEIENHPNTKIEDDFIEKIEAEFKKAETPMPLDKEVISKVEEVLETVKETLITTVEKVAEVKTEEIEIVTEKVEEVKAETETPIKLEVPSNMEGVELIKAPKPELKEIKVLRKIELPNMKKAEKAVETEGITEEKSSITPKDVAQLERELKESIEKPAPLKKKSTYKRPNKPMVKTKTIDEVLAEKRKKEEKIRKEEERKAKQQKEYDKKLKKEHYAAQVKYSKPKKKKKKVTEAEVVKEKTKKKTQEEKPKSWIGKLIHWFQTED